MISILRDQARAPRAIIALCIAVALVFAINAGQTAQHERKIRSINSATTLSWKMSELIFESQRLSEALADNLRGSVEAEEITLRLDLLWSRLIVAEESEAGQLPGLNLILADYRAFLERLDVAIAGARGRITRDSMPEVRIALADFAQRLRVQWVDRFAGRHAAGPGSELKGVPERGAATDAVVGGLILLLFAYVIAELVLSARDQRRERKLREQAAQSSAAKTRFLANVSHEIRTPLNGILGMASELSEGSLAPEQRDCVAVIEASGEILLATLNDVLDLSKIEAGEMLIADVPFDLRNEVAATRALFAASAREKGLELLLDIDPDVPSDIMGDPQRLRQVLHNLLSNAIKFTDQGAVAITAREAEDGQLRIDVTDSGCGLSESAREVIFKPFSQIDDGTTRKQGGTGLGLAISRQLCEGMGGSLDVTSMPGQGATFSVVLPLRRAADSARPEAPVRAGDRDGLAGLRVLVVDDNATNRALLGRFLAPAGCDTMFAVSGQDAVRQAGARSFDVILMDIQMPDLDGVTATRHIRWAEAAASRTPSRIVAVTANAMVHQRAEYLSAGMDDVLVKPVRKAQLYACMQGAPAAAA